MKTPVCARPPSTTLRGPCEAWWRGHSGPKTSSLRTLAAAAVLCLSAPAALAVDLPPEIAKRGSLIVAVVPNYPPLEFKDPATGRLTGFDIELGEAIAGKLGIRFAWQETNFDQMLPALTTGRVDAIMSGMTDYKSRQETATFVDYMRSGPQFLIQAARAGELKAMTDLCGRKVGASRRTALPREVAAWSEANCAGNPIVFVGTEGSADARTQLRQGRIDASTQGSETLAYIMRQDPGVYAPLGAMFSFQYNGIAVPVKETGLQEAIAGALDALIADGSYKALLARWQVDGNGIEKAMINAGR